MAGGGVAQGPRPGVEHHDHEGDELLVPTEGVHLVVELFDGLGRVLELPEEDPQQVLGLERGDGGFDAVTGDVADDRRDPRGGQAEEVVEVAGHHPRARLVDPSDLEADQVRQGLGRQALGPHARCPLLLVEDLDRPPLHADAALGQAGLADEGPPHGQGDDRRDGEDAEDDRLRGRVGGGQGADGHTGDAVEGGRVQVLAVDAPGQGDGALVGVGAVQGPPHAMAEPGRASPGHSSGQTEHSGGREDRDHHGDPMLLPTPDGLTV